MRTGCGRRERRPGGLLAGGDKWVFKDRWEHSQIWTPKGGGEPPV